MLRWPGPEIEKVQCTPGKVESVLSTLVCSQVKLFHVVDLKNKKAVIRTVSIPLNMLDVSRE